MSDLSTHVDKHASQETWCICITAQTLDPRTAKKVAFLDDPRFLLHWIDGRWRIRLGASENKLPETIVGSHQSGGGSVMVWVMFSWHALGPLIPVECTLNSCAYLSNVADQIHYCVYITTATVSCE
ncbi:hypothetical protein AVEN_144007-1 [Araneus ventricosus]|uniref:Uncharacterized protein n=1 Tax=Araneus ventricosus TaxID=182803 RepID=A0A4Y2U7H2_ARAVE|nr:hypothetical protein AVEN_144007-1 [Araneus ventricosus]